MIKQTEALTDDELRALAADVPPPDYKQALQRLRNTRRVTIDGGDKFPDIEVAVYGDQVTIYDEYGYVVLSAAALRQAAEWVASDRTPNPVLMTGPGTGAA